MIARIFRGYALITSWVDGDTFKGVLTKGGDDYEGSAARPLRFRCALIDAPEDKGDTFVAGMISLTWAQNMFPPGQEYPCWHYGRDKYGRTLVDLIGPDGRQFSELSLLAGRSVPYSRK